MYKKNLQVSSQNGKRQCLTTCAVMALALSGCAVALDGEEGDDEIVSVTAAVEGAYPLGVIDDSTALITAKQLVNAPPPAGLPWSVDFTSSLPSPGNQLSMGSCVGWAVGYATKSFHETVEEGWSPTTNNHRFSASWIYNQINFGVDGGSYISDALDLLVDNGCDTVSAFPYINGDFTTQPDVSSHQRAARFPALSWNTLTVSISSFKNELAAGRPIIIALSVLPDFDSLNGTTNKVYNSDSGSSRGRHAVTIIGYNNTDSTFKFINSWGTGYGNGGYGEIAYSFVANAKLNLFAYVIHDDTNLPLLGDTNGDLCVDNDDYDLLSAGYNHSVASGLASPAADFNNDGWVDILDYLTLVEHWLEGC